MKNTAILIVASLMLFLLPFAVSAKSSQVDLNIGGTAWYSWWQPAWADSKNAVRMIPSLTGAYNYYIEDSHDFKPRSNIMGGPVVAISFLERWNISSVFTIGKFKFASQGLATSLFLSPGSSSLMGQYSHYERDVLKMDSDTTISYSINRYVRIFGGFKYQGYTYIQTLYFSAPPPTPANFFRRDLTDRVDNYGPGLGIGINIPLVENFYMLMNVSGLILWGYEDIDIDRSYYVQAGPMWTYIIVMSHPGRFLSYGGSATLSLAYNIEKINTSIMLGGRYQVLYYNQRFSYGNLLNNDVAMSIVDGRYEHFWGVTLSAVYTFHINKQKT